MEKPDDEAEHGKWIEKVLAARKAIVEACGGPWKKGFPRKRGTIDCPICKGNQKLHYSRAGVNGHVHAQCETTGCIAWME